MKQIIKYKFGLLLVFALLVLPNTATAGTYRSNFWNEYQTDSIYLFLYDDNPSADVIFQDVRFSNPSWTVAEQSDTYLHLSGPAVDPWNIRFRITFTDNQSSRTILPFTLEWAEYLNGGPSAIDAMGSIELNRSGGRYNWIASNEFNSVIPNPLPASTWLLVSGICFLVGVRRHTRS